MLNIKTVQNGGEVTLVLSGRIDGTTASSLEVAAQHVPSGISVLRFDLTGVDYLSSAGLRVILAAKKRLGKEGTFLLKGVCPTVREIFDITGFSAIMTFE